MNSNQHSENHTNSFGNKIFFNKYKPDKKLGEGSFGKIYSAINVINQDQVALKMEPKDCSQKLLEGEAYILSYLKGYGIPYVKSYGYSGDYNILVMELLGKSLEDIFEERKKKFSLKTTSMIGIQMLDRIEFVHSKLIMHRDIKPDNFVIGLNNKNYIVYLLDFGLSKKYRSSRTKEHIKFQTNKRLTGTARYASINALSGYEQSRRDDLEGIAYVLLYFLRGCLPWQGLKVKQGEDKYKKILLKKKETSAEVLCEGFPPEYAEFVKYTRGLQFTADPDYNYLRGLLMKVISNSGDKMDFYFDWMTSPPSITNEDLAVNKFIYVGAGKKYKDDNSDYKSTSLTDNSSANSKNLNSRNMNINPNHGLNKDENNNFEYKHQVLNTGFDSNEVPNADCHNNNAMVGNYYNSNNNNFNSNANYHGHHQHQHSNNQQNPQHQNHQRNTESKEFSKENPEEDCIVA